MEDQVLQGFELSPQQKRLWLLQQDAGAGAFSLECAVEVEGELDRDAFARAWDAVVRRHEVLRTAFRCLPGMAMPLMVIADSAPQLATAGSEAGKDRERIARRWFRVAASRPFDLERGPLLEAALFRLEATRHLLLFRLPALLGDPAAAGNLVRELGRAYGSLLGSGESSEEPLQYADLSTWQNDLLVSDETHLGREYWRSRNLHGSLSPRLPFETAPEEGPPVPVTRLAVEVAPEVAAFAAHRGLEPATVLLACWSVLAGRLAGASEVVVGVDFDGRRYDELEGALGLLERCLPVRCRTDVGSPFVELLRQVEDELSEVCKWQETFAWEDLGLGYADQYFPLGFEVRKLPGALRSGGLGLETLWVEGRVDRHDLRLSCLEQSGSLIARFEYDPRRFRAGDVARLAERFEVLTASLVSDPDRPVGDVELLTPAERQQFLVELNDTAAPPAAHALVHRRFEERAAVLGERIAVVFGRRYLSYGHLNRRSNRLARYLIGLGVRPEDPVPICLERSAELVVALLAVMKSGGAYLPLETAQPKERLATLLREFSGAALVTREALLRDLPDHAGTTVLLDAHREAVGGQAAKDLAGEPAAENLAYLLFTSGSTGRPKAVAVEHRQLSSYVAGATARLSLPAGASYATVSTFAADLGNTMLVPALTAGSTLHVVAHEVAADARALAEHGERHAWACLKIVPGHLEALLTADRPLRVLPQRRLVLGGEAARWPLVDKLRSLGARCRIFNHYGPTETTVGVLTCRLDQGSEGLSPTLPLREVMPNCRIYLLDPRSRPVAPWVAGEIHIGGAGLSRGYFRQPALTATKFVPDPLSGEAGARLYRSADLARFLADGTIDFLRRRDRQIKIRGFRVELGEVEAQLLGHPDVAEAVAVIRPADRGPRLLAYLVPRTGRAVREEEVRSSLQNKLPAYMVPSAIVLLDALPLSANGKVDTRALPEPAAPAAADRRFVAPRTPVEELLAGLWSDLLGLGRVSVDDHFFRLGGHSLLATQLVSRLREVFQVEIPLRKVFEAPALGEMAQLVEAAARSGSKVDEPPIEPVDRRRDLPLSFAQERHWFLQQLDFGSPLYNIRGGVRIRGDLRAAALAASLREVVRRHDILSSAFPAVDGRPVQRHVAAVEFDLPVVDLRALDASERDRQLDRWATYAGLQPFDLERPPLVRAHLFRLADDEHLVFLTFHHIVADLWSMRVLIREAMPLYDALVRGLPSPLPRLPIQYGDFAVWQRGWLRGEVLESEIDHWRRRLQGAPRALALSIARPRPPKLSGRSGRLTLEVPDDLAGELRALSQRQGVSLFQMVLAAFQVLLRAYGGGDDLVVGAPIANRTRVQTEGLIGCFINALALRVRLDGHLAFSRHLARVREVVLDAYTHQDVPFEKLVQALNPDRDSSFSPIFQVVFNFANADLAPPSVPGLELELWGAQSVIDAKYDLILTAVDRGDGLAVSFTYSLDLFDAASVGRMMELFLLILRRVAVEPDVRLDELDRTSVEEDRRTRLDGEQRTKALRKRKLATARRKAVTAPNVMETSL